MGEVTSILPLRVSRGSLQHNLGFFTSNGFGNREWYRDKKMEYSNRTGRGQKGVCPPWIAQGWRDSSGDEVYCL